MGDPVRQPVCVECGHGHDPAVGCPDHRWRDSCPYYGLGCTTGEAGGRVQPCEGPLVWFEVSGGAAVLECAGCGYVVVSGGLNDEAHALTPLMREGLAG